MRVFLTGGTGFVGQSITERLLKRGVETIALVRNLENPTAKAIQEKGAQLIKGDITEPETMREAMKGADVLIHNAGWYEFGITN